MCGVYLHDVTLAISTAITCHSQHLHLPWLSTEVQRDAAELWPHRQPGRKRQYLSCQLSNTIAQGSVIYIPASGRKTRKTISTWKRSAVHDINWRLISINESKFKWFILLWWEETHLYSIQWPSVLLGVRWTQSLIYLWLHTCNKKNISIKWVTISQFGSLSNPELV